MKRSAQFTSLLLLLLALSVKDVAASEIQYPYHAPPERERAILEGYGRIKSGMNIDEVKKVLGNPDEVSDWYKSPYKNSEKIGFMYWYLIQRLKGPGSSFNEKKEKLVRVSFGLDKKVIKVENW